MALSQPYLPQTLGVWGSEPIFNTTLNKNKLTK